MKKICRTMACVLFALSLVGHALLVAGLSLRAEPPSAGVQRIEQYNKIVYQALSRVDDSMGDAEKALVLHDFLAANCEYGSHEESDTKYGALVDGKALCTGYAKAYEALLQKAGVPCTTVVNSTHEWNLVEIDGEWYHVDVTWDDARGAGQILHDYFLLSDDEIADDTHVDWYSGGIEAQSDHYRSYRFRAVESEMAFVGGYWYFVDEEGLWRYQLEKDHAELLSRFSYTWPGTDDWFPSLAERDGVLYYNSADTVYSLRPGGKPEVIYQVKGGGKSLFGLYLKANQTLVGLLRKTAEDKAESVTIRTLDPVVPDDYGNLYADGTDYFGAQYELYDSSVGLEDPFVAFLKDGTALTGAYEMPSYVNQNGQQYVVRVIEHNACYKNELLTSFRVSDTVTHIRGDAFFECSKLADISFASQTLLDVDTKAFDGSLWLKNHAEGSIVYAANVAVSTIGQLSGDVEIRPGTTVLDSRLFYGQEGITSITLPEGIGYIPDIFATGCSNLRRVVLPESVLSIGASAFGNCLNLSSIQLPDGLQRIDSYAFGNCVALREITLPKSLAGIDRRALSDCTALEAVNVEEGNAQYFSKDGVLFDRKQSLLFFYPSKRKGTHYKVPDEIRSIGSQAFRGVTVLETIDLNNVRSIDELAFMGFESLTSLQIPEGITKLSLILDGCEALSSISLPKSATEVVMPSLATLDALESISVAEGNPVYQSVDGVLYARESQTLLLYPRGKTDERLVIMEGTRGIADFMALNPYLKTIVLPNSLASGWEIIARLPALQVIEAAEDNPYVRVIDNILYDRALTELLIYPMAREGTELRIPEGITAVPYLDGEIPLTSVYLPSTMGSGWENLIGLLHLETVAVSEDNPHVVAIDGVLYDKSITEIVVYPHEKRDTLYRVPEGVRSMDINADTFEYIQTLILPSTISSFSASWYGLSALEEIQISEENTTYRSIDGILYDKAVTRLICYPKQRPDASWSVPEGIQILYLSVVGSNLKRIHLPASLTYMETREPSSCSLEAFTVAEGNENYTAVDGVLYNKDITYLICYPQERPDKVYHMPDTVTSVLTRFEYCRILEEVTFSKSITSLGGQLFFECEALKAVTIPPTVRSITGELFMWTNPTIYGYENSAAEAYAEEQGLLFVSIGVLSTAGDINDDGKVDTTDARLTLQYAVGKIELKDDALIAADVNGDGKTDTTDARLILQYAVGKISSFPQKN